MIALWAMLAFWLGLWALVDLRPLRLARLGRPVRTRWGTVPLYRLLWGATWAAWLGVALVLIWVS